MADADIGPLAEIMRRLRDKESGCPWDVEQNFATIAPYTIEEAYEVADAIDRGDMADLKGELGDLLLQVVFHSQMADEEGVFNLQDVVDSICDKMTRRHPHVFGDVDAENSGEVLSNWEELKAEERAETNADSSALSGVALALPALLRAQKIQKRAARTGFDWPDREGPKAKIAEELAELEEAASEDDRFEEMGDLLFAAVNLSRHYGIDAELALKSASQKFEKRFRKMEEVAGEGFAKLDLEEKEKLWARAKQSD